MYLITERKKAGAAVNIHLISILLVPAILHLYYLRTIQKKLGIPGPNNSHGRGDEEVCMKV